MEWTRFYFYGDQRCKDKHDNKRIDNINNKKIDRGDNGWIDGWIIGDILNQGKEEEGRERRKEENL